MTEEEIQKAGQITNWRLNEYGMSQLVNFGIFKKSVHSKNGTGLGLAIAFRKRFKYYNNWHQ